MTQATGFWCPSALLGEEWADDVLLSMDGDGLLTAVTPGVSPAQIPDGVLPLNGIALPGMANLHSHAHQRAMAGLGERASGDGDSFWTWRSAMYRTLERITPEQLYDISRMLYLEMLEAGYTHVAEFQYLHHDTGGHAYANRAEMTLQCARAAADLGIGFTALPVLYRYGGFGGAAPGDGQKRFLNDADDFLEILSLLDRDLAAGQRLGMAPHSLRAVDETLLRSVLAGLPAGTPIHLHIAEQVREVEESVRFSGMRPVEWLYDRFMPDPNWCLIHATHINDAELSRIARSGAVAGLCPSTEANLGDGIFPAMDFLQRGGVYGIGSDSHISVSPVEELRWLEYGQRLVTRRRNVLAGEGALMSHTGASLYTRAAEGGARAAGMTSAAIRVGNRADLVVLDADHPRLYGRKHGELIDSWIFSGNENTVSDVIVGGHHVVRDGSHPAAAEVRRNFRITIDRLAQ